MTLTSAPTLMTDRLILRSPANQDIDPVIDFLMDRPYADGFGASDTRADAWRWFMLNVGHWQHFGYGYFAVEARESGDTVGLTGVWNPHGWPEPELGYVIFRAYEGKGLAYEAATCARDWAYDVLGFTTLTSNIKPENSASKKLAARLGAVFERTYDNVTMGEDELWRHPGPEARA